jgi:hypothetical protein
MLNWGRETVTEKCGRVCCGGGKAAENCTMRGRRAFKPSGILPPSSFSRRNGALAFLCAMNATRSSIRRTELPASNAYRVQSEAAATTVQRNVLSILP